VLAVHVSATEWATGVCVPVPAREMFTGEFVALLVIVTLPLAVATEAGVNVTASVAVCPAPIDCPIDTPDDPYPVPLTVMPEIVTVVLPLFVSSTFCELLLPTKTFP
jgi:hypothetical protein